MRNYWVGLLVLLFIIVFLVSPPFVNRSEAVGAISFGLIFIGIPYTIYKILPKSQLSIAVAAASSMILGFAWGHWLILIDNYRINATGVITKGLVTSVWTRTKRYNGKENLFKVKFNSSSGTYETFSHTNNKNFRVGDSVSVKYVPSDPKTYRILELEAQD